MTEKNIDAEIKRKHEEFDRDIEAYLRQFRNPPQRILSPVIQGLRRKTQRIAPRIAPIRR